MWRFCPISVEHECPFGIINMLGGNCWTCSTTEEDIIVDPVESPEIVDDFELGQEEVVDIKDMEVNKQKLKRRASQYKVIP